MLALDRGLGSCVHSTAECRRCCFNKKFYSRYAEVRAQDREIDVAWQRLVFKPELAAADIAKAVERRGRGVKRFRWCTRGESCGTAADISALIRIAELTPHITHWIPTRAWRRPNLLPFLDALRRMPNVRLLASTDPEIPVAPSGWSSMHFHRELDKGGDHKCAKTWQKRHGACATCKRGCFAKAAVNVSLKQH